MDNWRKALAQLKGGESKYKALVQAIMQDIECGALKDGARLPPQRDLSQALGISVQTVTNAYKDLERHGSIRCEVGRGSFVSRRATEQVAAECWIRITHALACIIPIGSSSFSVLESETPPKDGASAWLELTGGWCRI